MLSGKTYRLEPYAFFFFFFAGWILFYTISSRGVKTSFKACQKTMFPKIVILIPFKEKKKLSSNANWFT